MNPASSSFLASPGEQACYRSPQWCKSFHERAYGVRGQAGKQVGQGVTPEGC
jgi:hypothetical protein